MAAGEALSRKAGVMEGLHGYFRLGADRLHRTCEVFGLFSRKLGDVLEVGPFYGYTPFLLRPQATSYTVFEGDDPAVYPLVPLYQEAGIGFSLIDLFEQFGPTLAAKHTLPLPDGRFDTILCWETMEHFNFNPVKFVRELHRVLRPGGRVYITVPNRASFQALWSLLSGRGEQAVVGSYFQFENYESNGKKAFYGFHWREYAPPELRELFTRAGFEVEVCTSFTVFQNHGPIGPVRKFARLLSQAGSALLPRHGTNVRLIATKRAAGGA